MPFHKHDRSGSCRISNLDVQVREFGACTCPGVHS